MTRDIQELRAWTTYCLIIASIATTSFPVLYMFSPWYKTRLGRAVMTQTLAFAVIFDLTLLFRYWKPTDPLVRFEITAGAYTFVALATSGLTFILWELNYHHRKTIKQEEENDDDSIPRS